MVITSKTNKTVAFVASLKNKKARREHSAYVVEGKKMVAEAFAAGKRVKLVMVAESVENEMSFPIEHITVSDAVFRYVSDEVTPQGVLAVLSIEKKTITKADGVSVLLDGISDPGNLGTIFRTVAAVGVKKIYLVNCCDPYSPKTVRSSMSGIYHVEFYECGYEESFAALSGVKVFAADMGGSNIFEINPPDDYCVVIGNEANGISEEIEKRADGIIGIPMSKTSESLNAAVSLAITLYTLTVGKGKSLIK